MRPITRLDAQRLVARQQDEISARRRQHRTPARDLYNEMLRPIAAQLLGRRGSSSCPTRTYEDAAFAALWDSSRAALPGRGRHAQPRAERRRPLSPPWQRLRQTRASSEPLDPWRSRSRHRRRIADRRRCIRPPSSDRAAATRARFFAEAPAHADRASVGATAPKRGYPLLSRVIAGRRAGPPLFRRDARAAKSPRGPCRTPIWSSSTKSKRPARIEARAR